MEAHHESPRRLSTCLLLISTFLIEASPTFSEEPDCEGFLCGTCGATNTELVETEEIQETGPTLGLFWKVVWASCPAEGNCCGQSSCTLSWTTTNVGAGTYFFEQGANLGFPLPDGYTLGANYTLKYQGSTSRTVQAGTESACQLLNCRRSTQELGPGYTRITRTVDVRKICHKPTYGDGGLLTCDVKDDCPALLWERTSTIKYLSHESFITGVCGLPVSPSGCPECADPQHPECP